MSSVRTLNALSYHYVRDFPRNKYPNIKGMLVSDFERQVDQLKDRFEVATLESAIDFLQGRYQPKKDLCLLTFDDGLKEHFSIVSPILKKRGLQGLFFIITSTVENHRVPEAHKSHFLMASLTFTDYKTAFLTKLKELRPDFDTHVAPEQAQMSYRWDDPEVAQFKFMLNFRLPEETRSNILTDLFARFLGDEASFSKDLFITWDEGRAMQEAGMILGGHAHRHVVLSALSEAERNEDLQKSFQLLRKNLKPQELWPFAYPYGKSHTYNRQTVDDLKKLGFACAFCTEVGENEPGCDLFSIRRIDPKEVR